MLDFSPKANAVSRAKIAVSPATSCLPLFFFQDPRLDLAETSETVCLSHPVGEKLSSRRLFYSGNLAVHKSQD